MNGNICVSCGEPIPEGRMICPRCEAKKHQAIQKIKIKLNTFNDVAEFVRLSTSYIGEVLVYSQNYIVSGKSIMGMYSIDLTNPIEVEFKNGVSREISESIKSFAIKE